MGLRMAMREMIHNPRFQIVHGSQILRVIVKEYPSDDKVYFLREESKRTDRVLPCPRVLTSGELKGTF